MRLAQDERADLAELLAGLTPEQWDTPSLCDRWRVRDVVAHVIGYDVLDRAGVLRRAARERFRPHRLNQAIIDEYADLDPARLLAVFTEHLRPAGLTTGFGGRIALTDALVHHQDIRRPLGLPREVPAERLAVVLPFARVAPPIGAFWRARGLRLVATDHDWSSGRGPLVEGPAEPLLMGMAGRRHALDELSGPGAEVLAGRITG